MDDVIGAPPEATSSMYSNNFAGGVFFSEKKAGGSIKNYFRKAKNSWKTQIISSQKATESSVDALSATITRMLPYVDASTDGRNCCRNFFPFQFRITTATVG